MEALPIAAPRQQADRPREARARVAQLVEHATENRSVGGSTPSPGTILSSALSRSIIVDSSCRQKIEAFSHSCDGGTI